VAGRLLDSRRIALGVRCVKQHQLLDQGPLWNHCVDKHRASLGHASDLVGGMLSDE
jgi:hypothetical protein